MLRKKYRVKGRVFLKGTKALHAPFFSARIKQNNLPFSRFGFVVSKRVDKRATKRNRVRRIASSCIEQMYGKIKGGHDILFFLKKEAVNTKRDIMHKALEASLREKGLLL